MFGKLFDKLKTGLTKTRDNLTDKINEALNLAVTIDDDMYEELEEALIMSDIGMDTTVEIIDRLKAKIRKEKINDVEMVKPALKEVIAEMMLEGDSEEEEEDNEKKVMLIIGVNGVGKTTSIGKIAARNKNNGKKVLLAAADTFRAAAIDQLDIWSQRANVDIVKHQEGSDPAAVVFDAVQAAKARDVDLLICDTAGRLHNKKNLMDKKDSKKKSDKKDDQKKEDNKQEEQQQAEQPAAETVYVTTKVNIRDAASTDGNVVEMLEFGTELKRTGTEGDWSAVEHNGVTGYVKSEYLSTEVPQQDTSAPSLSEGSTVTLNGTINIRESMSETSTKVAVGYAGDKVTVVMSYAEGWTKVNYKDTIGYIKTELLQ